MTSLSLAVLTCFATACAADPGDPLKSVSNAGQSGSVMEGTSGGNNGSTAGTASPPDDDGGGDDATSSDAGMPSDMPTQGEGSPLDGELSPDTTSTNDATATASCSACPIELKYMTTSTDITTSDIRPHYEIFNNGPAAQDLTVLTVRYYYTADGSTEQAYACDYAAIGCGSIQAAFVAINPAKANADHYMELSFSGASIPAGGNTGEIQVRFHDSGYQVMFTQTNDYSFDAAATQYADSDKVTVYRNGTLVWGVEPQ